MPENQYELRENVKKRFPFGIVSLASGLSALIVIVFAKFGVISTEDSVFWLFITFFITALISGVIGVGRDSGIQYKFSILGLLFLLAMLIFFLINYRLLGL